jgi:hypothetical protein
LIRQAISCDICGSEKKQTNHWFVAYDQGGELRVSGWNSRNRLRPGSKHLCGQTCLHKLVDDFMAKALAIRVQPTAADEAETGEQAVTTDTSLTSDTAYMDFESSARLIPTPTPAHTPVKTPSVTVAPAAHVPVTRTPVTRTPVTHTPVTQTATPSVPAAPTPIPLRAPMELVAAPAKPRSTETVPLADEAPRFASRNWRAEAWERERVRESRSGERHVEVAPRRRSGS